MAHTPGPWRVHSEHADRIIVNGCCVYEVRDMTTEDGYAGNGYGQPSPVDVRLMAAAPDLLAALKDCRDWLANVCDSNKLEPTERGFLEAATLALAKAEGRDE